MFVTNFRPADYNPNTTASETTTADSDLFNYGPLKSTVHSLPFAMSCRKTRGNPCTIRRPWSRRLFIYPTYSRQVIIIEMKTAKDATKISILFLYYLKKCQLPAPKSACGLVGHHNPSQASPSPWLNPYTLC